MKSAVLGLESLSDDALLARLDEVLRRERRVEAELICHLALERSKFAAASAPRKSVEDVDPAPSSRHIPDPIRRAVWERDGGQCTFRDAEGRRCPARERLEFHHDIPFGRGGDHAVDNVRILCSGHNAYQAERDYGAGHMADCRRARPTRPSSGRRSGPPPSAGADSEAGPGALAERDALDTLKRLGIRASDARRAISEASRSGAAHLEDVLREALRFLGRTTYASRASESRPGWPAGPRARLHGFIVDFWTHEAGDRVHVTALSALRQ
jgi:5-methylcytosine-specific restriction endonuclease McrA